MKELENVIEYITPKDAAKNLGIATETLRKYANLFDKVSGKDYFHRDSQNARIYSNDDITVLKRMIKINKSSNVTLETSVNKVLNELGITDITPDVSNNQNASVTDITALQQAVLVQNNMLGQYSDLMQQSLESNNQLKDEVKELIANQKELFNDLEKKDRERQQLFQEELTRLKKESEPKGFFAKIFKK